ncbi:DNA adenine methylase [Angustibacter sp. McL0619]|uniref:DNA adenine methylase n=1 Tax=Angustibacter sp. McL0619 TaxID=3415676 RepID=UPI003CF44A30
MTGAPPFAYYGGKTSIAERIVDALPEHRHYIEPFAGSLAVLLAKPRAQFETVNDLDEDLVTFWRVLRDRGDELATVCALTPHARAEHAASFDLDVADLERARRVWVRLSQGRGGMLRRTGWRFYRDAARRTGSMPWTLNAYVERMWDAVERLAGVSLECRPALQLIEDYGQHQSVLLYVDPPYLGTTRAWGNQYRHELRGDDEHRQLADLLRSCTASVVLSGYPSPLYDELYAGWSRIEIAAFTGQGGNTGRHGGRTEVLWSNRPIGHPHLFSEVTA